jgi:hypothetical protein
VDWPAEPDCQHSDGWQLDERPGRPRRRTWQRPQALEDDGRGWQRLPVEPLRDREISIVVYFLMYRKKFVNPRLFRLQINIYIYLKVLGNEK